MNIIKSQNPEEINVHRQLWGENAEEVIYGGRNNNRKEQDCFAALIAVDNERI